MWIVKSDTVGASSDVVFSKQYACGMDVKRFAPEHANQACLVFVKDYDVSRAAFCLDLTGTFIVC